MGVKGRVVYRGSGGGWIWWFDSSPVGFIAAASMIKGRTPVAGTGGRRGYTECDTVPATAL